jgi:putative endopeptidase
VDRRRPQELQGQGRHAGQVVRRLQPAAGYNVNGALTLGENIADNSGLAIAAKAYTISLKGKKPPAINGFTGEQLLYMGWAQVWREKMCEPAGITQVKTDPHSPGSAPTAP